jgi:methylglutamate dehydrogenase subunit D
MADVRILPLRQTATPGRFGAACDIPGVTLSIIHPALLCTVIARKGQGKSVATTLKSLKTARVMGAGPDQYYVQGLASAALKVKLGPSASVVDQSHGRVVIGVAGLKARHVLAKGTPVDLHQSRFPVGTSALTQMAHVGVHVTRTDVDIFELSVFRGFSETFWEWLTAAAAEFGYDVR